MGMLVRRYRGVAVWTILSLILAGAIHEAIADQTYTFSGTIDTKGPKWVEHRFDVPGASVLSITLEQSDPNIDVTLSLKDPSGSVVRSARASSLELAALEVEASTAGTWSVLLRAKRGGVGYTVVVDVLDRNRAPEVLDDQASTKSPDQVLVPVLGNDSDPDGDTLRIASVSAPNHGGAHADGEAVSYRPDDGFAGTDSFTYQACDDGVPILCTTAKASIDVQAPDPVEPSPTSSPSPTPSPSSSPSPTPSPSPSPDPGGAIAPLVKGLSTRGGVDPDVGAFIQRVYWSDLQPNAYGPIVHPNLIDSAIAKGKPVRVRIYGGRYAPQWVKNLGSVSITDPFQQTYEKYVVPQWWTARYVGAYTDLITKLAAAYDGKVPAFTMSGPMSVCAEPFLHQIGSMETRAALLAAGWSTSAERGAFKQLIDAHKAFKTSRTLMAINPGQTYDPATGKWSPQDVAYMKEITNYFVSSLGRQAIVQNNSLNVTRATKNDAYVAMYSYMKQLHASGVPIAFQTAQTSLVENLPWVLDYAVDEGAHLVELPESWSGLDTAAHLAKIDAELRANEP